MQSEKTTDKQLTAALLTFFVICLSGTAAMNLFDGFQLWVYSHAREAAVVLSVIVFLGLAAVLLLPIFFFLFRSRR